MVILVCSCDKNADTFGPFRHCMEKYWPGHPTILYSTETVQNPYYKTVSKNYPISKWTKRIRETLNDISDDAVYTSCPQADGQGFYIYLPAQTAVVLRRTDRI